MLKRWALPRCHRGRDRDRRKFMKDELVAEDAKPSPDSSLKENGFSNIFSYRRARASTSCGAVDVPKHPFPPVHLLRKNFTFYTQEINIVTDLMRNSWRVKSTFNRMLQISSFFMFLLVLGITHYIKSPVKRNSKLKMLYFLKQKHSLSQLIVVFKIVMVVRPNKQYDIEDGRTTVQLEMVCLKIVRWIYKNFSTFVERWRLMPNSISRRIVFECVIKLRCY